MLFSGDVFDVEGITVNRTRGGGDVELQAVEAERITALAGLRAHLPGVPRRERLVRRDRAARRRASFDGASAVNEIIKQAKAAGARRSSSFPWASSRTSRSR